MTEKHEPLNHLTLQEKFEGYLQSIDPQVLGLSNIDSVSCTPLEGGTANVTYLAKVNDNKKFILRFHPKSDDQTDHTAEEYKKLKEANGLHAPKALHLGKPDFINSSALIMEFEEGEHKDFNALTPVEIKNFANAVADIHSITRANTFSKTPDLPEDAEGTHYDYIQSHLDNTISRWLNEADPSIYQADQGLIQRAQHELNEQIEQHKEAFSSTTFSYLHNDIVVLNVLWNKDQPTIIDWEVPAFGDRADEVAYIFAINNTSNEFNEVFLEEYEKHVDDPTLRERIEIYKLKNRLLDVAWAISKLDEEAKGQNPLMKREKGLYKGFYDIRLKGLRECLEL